MAQQYLQKDEVLFAEVQKLMNGQYDSYENVYELSKHYIYKIVNDIVKNHHTTEDMMQETYLQIYNKIGTLQDPRAFYVWAGRIASNITLRYIQKYRKEMLSDVPEGEDESAVFANLENDIEEFIPETVLINTEQQRIIANILEQLSPEQKLAVQFFYYEEMSVNDIAQAMNCSTGTVKSRLNYARKALKQAISQFETRNDVKLYSLAAFPVFYFVFREISESAIFGGTMTAMAAGLPVTAADTVGRGSGMGTGMGVKSTVAASRATGAGTMTSSATTSSVTASSATAAGSTMAGSTAAASGGFLSTIGGKVAIVLTSLVVGGGTTVGATTVVNEITGPSVPSIQIEIPEIEVPMPEIPSMEFAETENPEIPEITSGEINANDPTMGITIEIDSRYQSVVTGLEMALQVYKATLNGALTEEQRPYLDQFMVGYEAQTQAMQSMGESMKQSDNPELNQYIRDNYYEDMISLMEEQTDILNELISIYGDSEVSRILYRHSGAELEQILNMGGGIGDLIAPELSERLYNQLMNTSQKSLNMVENYNSWINRFLSDPVILSSLQ